MRHVADGEIRRLLDEPEAVSDEALAHLAACNRCGAHLQRIEADAIALGRQLAPLQPVRDVRTAWDHVAPRLGQAPAAPPVRRVVDRSRLPRLAGISVSTASIVVAGVLVVGSAAAAAGWSTLFAPTHVAPVTVTRSDVSAISSLLGTDPLMLGDERGSARTFAFGTVTASGLRPPATVATVADAERLTGLHVSLPTKVPPGIGSPDTVIVQEPAEVMVHLGSGPSVPAGIAGTSIAVTIGPAVLVEYGGDAPGLGIPTLAVVTMRRPTALSTGATIAQLEDFLLTRPGFPSGLAQDIRLLGDGGTTLPVPTPPGMSAQSADIGGSEAVVVSDPDGVASGVVWEDSSKVVHAVAGLLGASEVVILARQID